MRINKFFITIIMFLIVISSAQAYLIRTRAIDGPAFDADGTTIEINPCTIDVGGVTKIGTPAANFNINANLVYELTYSAAGYTTDVDDIYLDSGLPTCIWWLGSCDLSTSHFTTHCDYRSSVPDWDCRVTDTWTNQNIRFAYNKNDPTYGEVVRRTNKLYHLTNNPPYLGGIPDKNINEDSGFHNNIVDLYAYHHDMDGSDAASIFTIRSQSNPGIVNCVVNADRYIDCTTQTNRFGANTIVVRATDVEGAWAEDTFIVNVVPVNDPPAVSGIPDQTIIEGDSFATFDLDNYLTELDGDTIIWSYSGNTDLNVVINGNNVVTITTPNIDWNGVETISFTATDDNPAALSNSDSAVFTVNGVNDPPVANDDIVEVDSGDSVLIDVLANDDDVEDGTPSLDSSFPLNPSIGSAQIEGNQIRYTSVLGHIGPDVFTYRVRDSIGATDTAIVSITVNAIGILDIVSLDCFPHVIENHNQSCSVYVEDAGTPIGNVDVDIFYSDDTLFNSCTTDTISGGCETKDLQLVVGNHTVYAVATSPGYIPDEDGIPPYTYEVLTERYIIDPAIDLRIYNDPNFQNLDYDFFRNESMYVEFEVYDLFTGDYVSNFDLVTQATLVSPPGGRANLTHIGIVNGSYRYELVPIPPTHQFLGTSQLFTFAFNFSDGSGGQAQVDLMIRNNPPVIDPSIGQIDVGINGNIIQIDLTAHENDVEDSGNDLTWNATESSSYFDADIVGKTLTVTGLTEGTGLLTLRLYDLDNDYDEQYITVNVSATFSPQCSNDIDDDSDGLTDEEDPGCHTDGNPSNPASYDPLDDDESDSGIICSTDLDCGSPFTTTYCNGLTFITNDTTPVCNDAGTLSSYCTYPSVTQDDNCSNICSDTLGCDYTECSDGDDNDLDTYVDFPLDLGCDDYFDDDEFNYQGDLDIISVILEEGSPSEVEYINEGETITSSYSNALLLTGRLFNTYGSSSNISIDPDYFIIRINSSPEINASDSSINSLNPQQEILTEELYVPISSLSPGTYRIDFYAEGTDDYNQTLSDTFYLYLYIPTQCANTFDDDSDNLTDSADPGCHTDGDPNNLASYDPYDDNESDSGITCFINTDCGTSDTTNYCNGNSTYITNVTTPSCVNPGTLSSYCSDESQINSTTCNNICSDTLGCDYTQCSDTEDNDADLLIDFPADPGCEDYYDDDERDINCTADLECGSAITTGYCTGLIYNVDTTTDICINPGTPESYCTQDTVNDLTQLCYYICSGALGCDYTQCSDRQDNDGDDLIDTKDPGCDSYFDDDEFNFFRTFEINPRKSLQVNKMRFNREVLPTIEVGGQLYVDLKFTNIGMNDIRKGTIRITIPDLGISRKLGPFSGPDADDAMNKGVLLDIPDDAQPGVYSVRVTLSDLSGIKRTKHRDFIVTK